MAGCLRIRHGGGGIGDSVIRNHGGGYNRKQQFSGSNLSMAVNHRLSTATATVALSLFDDGGGTKRINGIEKLDEWMQYSVTEIVKNIKQAPLLVQIYADGEVKTQKALPENVSKHRLSSLEGVMLVEELEQDLFGGTCRAFGVLVQGRVKGRRRRRDECKSTCYLLKTSSVNNNANDICTHFCLIKVQSFHKDAFSQFNDCWLLR